MKNIFIILSFISISLNAQTFKSFYYFEDIYAGSNWTEVIKSESAWDALSSQSTNYDYNLVSTAWIKQTNTRTILKYNTNKDILEYNIEKLKNGSYLLTQKSAYSYTSFGKVQEILITVLDTNTSTMKNAYKYTYKYDNSNRRTVYQLYTWDDSKSSFVNPTGDSISYTSATYYELFEWNWDATLNANKISEFKSGFILDNSGNILKQNFYRNNAGNWNRTNNITYTYNLNNLQVSSADSTFLTGNLPTKKQTFTYNSDNKLTETIRQTYNGTVFVDEFKQTRTYNTSKDEVERINFLFGSSTWNFNRRYRWVYGNVGLTSVNKKLDLRVYSSGNKIYITNPSSQRLPYTIQNMLGQECYKGRIMDKEEKLELNLPSGIYFMSIENSQIKFYLE